MLTGTATPDEFLGHAATIDAFAAEAVTLPGAEVLQAAFEIRIAGRESSLPPGLHPTNPPTFVLQVWRCPDSPWGAFSLAQGRVGARSGLRLAVSFMVRQGYSFSEGSTRRPSCPAALPAVGRLNRASSRAGFLPRPCSAIVGPEGLA